MESYESADVSLVGAVAVRDGQVAIEAWAATHEIVESWPWADRSQEGAKQELRQAPKAQRSARAR